MRYRLRYTDKTIGETARFTGMERADAPIVAYQTTVEGVPAQEPPALSPT